MSKHLGRNRTLSIFEAIATYFVVFIHFIFPGEIGIFIRSMGKFAVPMFFAISGFFYYRENHLDEIKSIKRKIVNLLKILILSEFVYCAWYLLLYFRKYGFSIRSVIDGILVNVKAYNLIWLIMTAPIFNFIGWFIGELILVYCIYYFISKYCKNYKIIYIIMFILMFIGITLFLILDYCGFDTAYYRLSLPFMGLPFFTLGHFINQYKEKLMMFGNPVFLVISILLFIVEYIIYGYKDNYYSVIIFILFVFAFSIKHLDYSPRNLISKGLDNVGAKYSTFIYIMHPLIGGIIGTVVSKALSDHYMMVYNWINPIVVAIASTICSIIFYKTKDLVIKKVKSGESE